MLLQWLKDGHLWIFCVFSLFIWITLLQHHPTLSQISISCLAGSEERSHCPSSTPSSQSGQLPCTLSTQGSFSSSFVFASVRLYITYRSPFSSRWRPSTSTQLTRIRKKTSEVRKLLVTHHASMRMSSLTLTVPPLPSPSIRECFLLLSAMLLSVPPVSHNICFVYYGLHGRDRSEKGTEHPLEPLNSE